MLFTENIIPIGKVNENNGVSGSIMNHEATKDHMTEAIFLGTVWALQTDDNLMSTLAPFHSGCARVSLHLDGERTRVQRHSRPTETRGAAAAFNEHHGSSTK